MVRKVLSFRALFRKASWMFCASFSIGILWPVRGSLSCVVSPPSEVAQMVTIHDSASVERALLGRTCLRLCNQILNIGHQTRSVVRNSILDGPFDAACVNDLSVANVVNSGRIKHLQILERVPVYD